MKHQTPRDVEVGRPPEASPKRLAADPGLGDATARCPFIGLDTLWIQVTGLRCNLACVHCFNSSGPTNTDLSFLDRTRVGHLLDEAETLGARDVAFTGGEPFLHPDMPEMAGDALERFPTTILTNGTLLTRGIVARLGEAAARSRYSLEIRVSVDSATAAANDDLRGDGVFRRALAGIARLHGAGFLPILTAVRTWPPDEDLLELEAFEALLRRAGVGQPRVKLLPPLSLGREAGRTGGYGAGLVVSQEMLDLVGPEQFLCSASRLVTSRGVWACPILVAEPSGRMADTLADALVPLTLDHGACTTCLHHGAICSNVTVRE
ncbi:MAG: radical SAM protein [Anaerolineae bacterium]